MIDGAPKLLDKYYLYPVVARRVSAKLMELQRQGEYKGITDGEIFAIRLGDDLVALSGDKHIAIDFFAKSMPGPQAGRDPRRLADSNCGFEKADHFAPNVGYLKLTFFAEPAYWNGIYRYTMLDQTDLWLEEGGAEIRRQSPWVYEWNDALVALDRYPWAELRPLEIDPRFADQILTAARNRLAKGAASSCSGRRLAVWSTLCHG